MRIVKMGSLLLLIIAAIVGGYCFYSKANNGTTVNLDPTKFDGTLLPIARNISDFSLMNHLAQPFTTQSLKGKWTFMFFGFTSCPEICPATMTNLAKLYQLLEQRHARILPQVALVSVDPERDTPEQMKKYISSFNTKFVGVTGNQNAIDRLANEVGVAYMKVAKQTGSDDSADYDIEHSGTLMLFNPEGKLQGFFTTPHDMEKIANDYLRLIS